MTTVVVPGAFTRASSFERLAGRLGATVVELPVRSRRLPQLDLGGLRAADAALDRELDAVHDGSHDGAHGGTPLVLVGHSMGGLLALRAARRRPVDALVLLMPAPPDGLLPDLARLAGRDPVSALKLAMLAGSVLPVRSLGRVAPPRGLFTTAATPEELTASVRHRAAESFSVLTQLAVGSRGRVEPLGVPTLVVGGRDDGLVPPATARRLAERLDADHLELPVAHNFSEEAAGVVVEDAVRDWLAARVPGAVGAG